MSDEHLYAPHSEPWQPWQMAPLAREPLPETHPDAAQAEARRKYVFQRKLELQALRNKARQQAHAQGHAAGFEAGQQQGYREGLAQGQLAGEQAMQEQIQQALVPLLGLCQSFGQALEQLEAQMTEHLARLAMAAARQLVGEALDANPEQVCQRVQALLLHEPALTGKPRLWLNPAELATVQDSLGTELFEAGWTLHADATLARGGCRVVSAHGELDATLETAWAGLERSLRQGLGEPLAGEP